MHSDLVSLGSRVWPAPLPAHSSASELAAPALARDTYCYILIKLFFKYKNSQIFSKSSHHASRLQPTGYLLGCNLFVTVVCLCKLLKLLPHLSSTPVADSLLCKAATALDVILPLEERWKLSLQDLHSDKWKDKRDTKVISTRAVKIIKLPRWGVLMGKWDMWQVTSDNLLVVKYSRI